MRLTTHSDCPKPFKYTQPRQAAGTQSFGRSEKQEPTTQESDNKVKTINIIVYAVEVTVEYYYNKACRGAREKGSGIQLEPDEVESIEVHSVRSSDDIYNLLEASDLLVEIETEILSILNDPQDEQ